MDSTINNIYIICQSNKSINYKKLENKFKNNDVAIGPWTKEHIKERIKERIKSNKHKLTTTCNILCTDEMISEWITHVTLWHHIYNSKLDESDRIMILDENVIVADNFIDKLDKIWEHCSI